MENKTLPRIVDKAMNEFTERFMLPDRAIDGADMPWMPFDEKGSWFKPLRFDFTTGMWINLFKVDKGAELSKHRHTGGFVIGYTIQGKWKYLEKDWSAKPGTLIFEPPGDIHTLSVDPSEDMITLFMLDGSLQFIDDNNGIYREDDVFTLYKRYRDYCEANNMLPDDNLCF
ncbi:cupin [Bacillus sp. M6-12]|uniref:2,4'-dihydroxyacetophenone dioxygenase family protein n=1 Tax=Bacillus sp. M6-12 TaxID=2054166 RepID=UPI000C75D3D9|nr:2,4'-dihydroxyacetophenone dioxygenase family protein [Bacillus sp. M6-12]PLS14594.1 cupin [Bacillus sp. M6-12]